MYYVKYNNQNLLETSSKDRQVLKTKGKICASDITIKLVESISPSGDEIGIIETYNDQKELVKAEVMNGSQVRKNLFNGEKKLEEITLPNSISYIGDHAFSYCSSLTNITIPDSVTSIGDWVFEGCDNLTQINVSENNEAYLVEDDALLKKDKTSLIVCLKGKTEPSYRVPDGVKLIDGAAFSRNNNLTNITIPDSVTTIWTYAFQDCKNLKDVYYKGNQTQWKAINILYYNEPLTKATIHYNTVTWNFENGVLTISGDSAIDDFGELSESSTPDHIIITRKSRPWGEFSETAESIIIENGVKGIGSCACSGFSNVTSITIPNSVTNIGFDAFGGTSNLTNITIPNSVLSIGSFAFMNSGITNITIPDSVTSLGDSAFWTCSNLTNVVIGNGITCIPYRAFFMCGLKNVTIGNCVESIEEEAFFHCNIKSLTIPDNVKRIEDSAFELCGIETLMIGSGVTMIGDDAFSNCRLENLIIPDNVTEIGWNAFEYNSLKTVTIGNGVTKLERNTFAYNPLTTVTLGSGITKMDDFVFYKCEKLTTINVPWAEGAVENAPWGATNATINYNYIGG